MKIAILGAADIAFRRFLPALRACPALEYAGVASRSPEKGEKFKAAFGGSVYPSYKAALADPEVEAVYLPLPPALHAPWGERALEAGKHVLMEKPFSTSLAETKALLDLAEARGLAVQENYMFLYHSQLKTIRELIESGELGQVWLYRISFGIPRRQSEDFRLSRALGGGALLDCGGYPIRLAWELLGESGRVTQAELRVPRGAEVDFFGSAVLENDERVCAQVSFGIDNAYQCTLEAWGSRATLIASRIFTAGAGVRPELILRRSTEQTRLELPEDDHFLHSMEAFSAMTRDMAARKAQRAAILRQARLVEDVRKYAERP